MIRAALLVAILVVASPQYLSANPLMNSMNGLASRLTSNEPGGFTSGLNQAFNGLTFGMADAARGFMAGNSSQQLYQPQQQQQLLQQQQQMYGQMPPPPPPHHGLFPPGHHHRRGPPGPPPPFGMMGQMDQYNPYQSMQQFSPQMNPQTQSYEMLTLQMRNYQLQQEYQRMQKHLEELLQRQYMNPQMYSNNNQLGQQQQSFGLPQNMQMNGQPQQQQQLQHQQQLQPQQQQQQQQQNGQNRWGLSQLYNGLRQYVPFGGQQQQQPQQDQLPLPNQPQQQQQQQQQQQLPLAGQQQPLQQQLQQLQQPGQQPQQANNVNGRPASLPRSNTL